MRTTSKTVYRLGVTGLYLKSHSYSQNGLPKTETTDCIYEAHRFDQGHAVPQELLDKGYAPIPVEIHEEIVEIL